MHEGEVQLRSQKVWKSPKKSSDVGAFFQSFEFKLLYIINDYKCRVFDIIQSSTT